jgi:signal transduction histidine kinase
VRNDLEPESERVTLPPQSTRSPSATGNVWIVDDSAMQAEIARRAIARNYTMSVFENGATMLESLVALGPPDILILDWHMPEMSGEDLCRFVRQTYDIAQLPILVLTASATQQGVLDALAAGANDFVRKPFAQSELDARVATLVGMATLNRRLSLAQRSLEVEAEFRERFMGMLAHDLRQPLNAITMASHGIGRTGVPPQKLADFLAMQLRAAGRMRRMIGDLLDFTRNRPLNAMPVQRQTVDFAEIVRSSLEEITLGHPERTFEIQATGNCTGDWDPDRIAQLCSNLIGNAIEHSSPASAIAITLAGNDEQVALHISNVGPDIPKAIAATLFQPFRRLRPAKRSIEGVGLGLHIVDQIVRAHAGTIAVVSESGKTEFIVTLPRSVPVRGTEAAHGSRRNVSAARVLEALTCWILSQVPSAV